MGERGALIVGAAALLALAAVSRDEPADRMVPADEPPIWERIDRPSEQACGGCHAEVFAEWSESLHADAWTNANAQAATNGFQKKSCRKCHSPHSVLETGLDVAPIFREENREDGVHCLSCHGRADGVGAARTVEGAPCNPIYDPRVLSVDLCWPCHEPTHQAFEEYEVSDAKALGVRCVDCHMQPTTHRRGRSHGSNGGLNPDFVKRAVAWECRLVDRVVEVELRNRTGHKFPGEIPSRSFLVDVAFRGAGNLEPADLLLRKPHKGEEREDNRLKPDESRVLRFPLPEGATGASVTLTFLPLPLLPREQGFEIGSWRSE